MDIKAYRFLQGLILWVFFYRMFSVQSNFFVVVILFLYSLLNVISQLLTFTLFVILGMVGFTNMVFLSFLKMYS